MPIGATNAMIEKNNTKNNKIPAWAWAVSGLLVGLIVAWIVVEFTAGKASNVEQSNNGGYGAAISAENASSGVTAPQPQINSNAAANEKLAQEQSAYARLQAANNTVTSEAINNQETSQMMGMMGKTLANYYSEVRTSFDIGVSDCPYGSSCDTDFWVDFAKQALGEDSLQWNFAEQAEAKYHSFTGSYTYVDAKKQLDELVFAPYGAGVTSTDSDAEKINKILNFITSNIHYEYDMSETPQAPAETLAFKSGDCKDFSILASAAFADAGISSAIMRMQNASGTLGHAMVLIQSNENLPLYGSYADLTREGLPTGRWWVIEPQFTLSGQTQHPSWFAGWKLENAALVSNN